jgi:hypothetical protein
MVARAPELNSKKSDSMPSLKITPWPAISETTAEKTTQDAFAKGNVR